LVRNAAGTLRPDTAGVDPFGVSRRSALSARSDSRHSAREVNMRYGLGDAERGQVVDQDADVAVRPVGDEVGLPAGGGQRRVDAGHDPLRRGLLVAGGPVHLPGQEQAPDRAQLQRRVEFPRVDVVVLDRVAGPEHHRALQPGDRGDHLRLHLARQRGRDPVRIDRVVVEPLRLEEDLVRSRSAKRTTLSSIDGQ
jgi:hypothetical protein